MLVRTDIQGVVLAAAATTYVLMLKASASPIRIHEIGCSFRNGAATDQAVRFEALRATTDGTATTGSVVKLRDDASSPLTTATHTFTADPTAGNLLHSFLVSPAPGGGHIWRPPELPIIVPGAGRIVLRVTTQSGVTPTSDFYIVADE